MDTFIRRPLPPQSEVDANAPSQNMSSGGTKDHVRQSWIGVERRDSSCKFVGMTRNLIGVGHDMPIAALNTGKLSPDHRVERNARDRTVRQVRFQAADAAAKRVLFDEMERGESPVAICLDF